MKKLAEITKDEIKYPDVDTISEILFKSRKIPPDIKTNVPVTKPTKPIKPIGEKVPYVGQQFTIADKESETKTAYDTIDYLESKLKK